MKCLYRLAQSLCITFFLSHSICAQETEGYKTNSEIKKTLADSASMSFHFAAWSYSFIGEYQKALSAFDRALESESAEDCDNNVVLSNYESISAKDYIVDQSKNEQIIIVNEAHHQPLHRVFTESLLEGLYQNGFRYLGLEALAEDSLINIRKWPMQNDGYYSKEPQFGNMIRKALKIGFFVFGYEADGNGKIREIGQAKNIQKVLNQDPGAKILLHCGFNHVVEGDYPAWGKAMAGQLKELSGINPLTIDQVELSEHNSPNFESPCYKPEQIDFSAVLIDKKHKPVNPGADSAQTDLQIIHPRTKFISGRPDWLQRNNAWKVFDLTTIKFDVKFPCLVGAYYENEDENAVPVDQIEINNQSEKALILPAGNFVLRISDQEGITKTQKIIVE
ncbi:hypothetical protein [Dyadobacter diqingensis]|uniref:hypothetical protein n=1 Tax=Dyadobacter diqingensis TaxID=2938121 RepID=UPI0020C19054|nr:hypothetical protein [Dyadobacter diqingensis]